MNNHCIQTYSMQFVDSSIFNFSFILKKVDQDFIVEENLPVFFVSSNEHPCIYFWLHKKHYTTMEAVQYIADFIGVSPNEIGYAGLKDENALTSQKISLPNLVENPQNLAERFNKTFDNGSQYIKLFMLGYADAPIKIGRLNGNSFRIIIRNVKKSFAEILLKKRKFNFFFLNYYDYQRFGLEGKKKVTHLIGKELLNKNYDKAFEYLMMSESPESKLGMSYKGNKSDFFLSLPNNTYSFYCNSYSSYLFNQELSDKINCYDYMQASIYPGGLINLPLDLDLLTSRDFLNEHISLLSYRWFNGILDAVKSFRDCVKSSLISVQNIEEDPYFLGKYCVEVTFSLPPGTYATMLVKQLEWLLRSDKHVK